MSDATAETWKRIPGYANYEVSDHGRVRTWIFRSKPLAEPRVVPQSKSSGKPYLKVFIAGDNRLVHRLVMLAFVGPVPDGMEVCHNDSTPANNRLSNLRYDTKASNERDKVAMGRTRRGEQGPNAKLTPDDVQMIRQARAAGVTHFRLAWHFDVSERAISSILSGKTWGWLPPETVTGSGPSQPSPMGVAERETGPVGPCVTGCSRLQQVAVVP